MQMPVLVDAAWLLARLDDPDLTVVDCRFVLGDPAGGRRLYHAGHIRHASFMDVDADLAAPPAPPGARGPVGGRHPLPDPADLQDALRRAGVVRGGRVVAYDQGMTGGAARLWWLLRHHGFEDVAVLRGGFAAWDGPLEAGPPAPREGTVVLGPPRDDVAGADALLEGGVLLLDARAPARFRGEEEPVDPVAGHIPGARNLPFTDAFPPPGDVLADPRPVVVSCGSGVTACVVALALAEAGRDDARLYAGSWSDWVARDLPVATGAEPSMA